MQGVISADAEQAVVVKLEEMGYMPVAITRAKGEKPFNSFFDKYRGVRFSDLNMFTRLLFTLTKAGLPLLSSLNSIKAQTENPIFRDVIAEIARDIEGGAKLSTALGRHPRIFNALYVNMVKSGEVSGKLVEILDRLMTLGEHEELTRLRIMAALRYPLIVIGAVTIGFLVLITFVVPRFERLYGQFTTELPLPTKILLGLNYTITHYWWAILLGLGAAFFLLFKLISSAEGLRWWDGLKLKIPVLGPLLLKLTMSRFCRVTGTLLSSGVPILQILELVSESVGNAVISDNINAIKKSVNEGKGMLEPMKASGMFPPVVIQMVAAGEATGKMDTLLLHVSDYYDSQIDYTIKNLISLIEPLLIFVIGSMVGFMALGIFLPMWGLMDIFKGK